jgi:hypothetical protein
MNEGMTIPRQFIINTITTDKIGVCNSKIIHDILFDKQLFDLLKHYISNSGNIHKKWGTKIIPAIDYETVTEIYIDNLVELFEMDVFSEVKSFKPLFETNNPAVCKLILYLFCRPRSRFRFKDAHLVFKVNETIRKQVLVSYLESDIPSVVMFELVKHAKTGDWPMLLSVIDALPSRRLRGNIIYELQKIMRDIPHTTNQIICNLGEDEKHFSCLLKL